MEHRMSIPRWDDPNLKAGTMVRTALWLLSEVGLGNTFTKETQRQVFSGVAQADRRLRDLREFGWIIHTSAEDVTLNSNEQRFVAAGLPVWEPGVKKQSVKEAISAKIRMVTFAEHDYQCVVCGIAAGERYEDGGPTGAVLSVASQKIVSPDGEQRQLFTCLCKRCRAGSSGNTIDLPKLLDEIEKLEPSDRASFLHWAAHGRRNALDRAWSRYRSLASDAKDLIRARLKEG
jgi:hypothetical protein